MRSTPLTCCSIGAATVSATTCALAPGYAVFTRIIGGAISGYWATGKVGKDTAPAIMMRIAITHATIGRRMKNRLSMRGPTLSRCKLLHRRLHCDPRPRPLQSVDHDAVIQLQPLGDHPHRPLPVSYTPLRAHETPEH